MENGFSDDHSVKNNQVFNHRFMLPNHMQYFPAGWQICRWGKNSQIFWQRENPDDVSVAICNQFCRQYSSICQERPHYIPVHPHEEWEFGAVLRADRNMYAMIKVHFLTSRGHISCSEQMFMVRPESCYYNGIITIPEGVQWAYLEIGTNEPGILWIQEVFFMKVDSPCKHKINVGTVDTVRRILEPVKIKKLIVDTAEDVVAIPAQRCTETQNVFLLNTYTYSVLNLGTVTAFIHMQCSPDGIHFLDEPIGEEQIEPNQLRFLACNYALPYVRLCFRTETDSTNLRIFLQGHD